MVDAITRGALVIDVDQGIKGEQVRSDGTEFIDPQRAEDYSRD